MSMTQDQRWERHARMVQRIVDGEPFDDVLEDWGICEQYARHLCTRAGVKLPPKPRKRRVDGTLRSNGDKIFRAMHRLIHNPDWTYRQIGEEIGASRQYIEQIKVKMEAYCLFPEGEASQPNQPERT